MKFLPESLQLIEAHQNCPLHKEAAPTNDALPEEIGLSVRSVTARKFPINLVLYIRHGNESGDYATPAARLHY